MADDDDDEQQERSGGGIDPELIRSYLRYVRRSVRAHRLLMAIVFVVGLGLTVAARKYLPRTYECTTVLMVDSSKVLEGDNSPNWLVAAESLIMRHDNLESIVRQLDLIKKFRERRPPLPALKDRVVAAIMGELDDETMMASLVGTLEQKMAVKVKDGVLTITVDWTDGHTAAEIAEAARETFVKTRHVAEMSAFEDKLAILDGHAASVRDELDTLAKQARELVENHQKDERSAVTAAASAAHASDDSAPATAAAPRPRVAEADDPEIPRLKTELEEKRTQLAAMERERSGRIDDARRKLADLKLKYTPSFPEVVRAQQQLDNLQQVPSDLALLRADVQSLDTDLQQRTMLKRGPSTGVRGVGGLPGTAAATPEPLPREITALLDAQNIDPALAAQLSSAMVRYGSLRDEIRSAHIQFDTAQAAFNYRYKVVVPADVPKDPIKPKGIVVIGAGLVLSLLLAIVLPILAELRSGVMVERWQVAMVQLPVLAELRLPAMSGDPPQGGPISTRKG